MRARSYDHWSPAAQNSVSSHFLGLERVLDKYKQENHILCQKIQLLLSENKGSGQCRRSSHRNQSTSNKYNQLASLGETQATFDIPSKKSTFNHGFLHPTPQEDAQSQYSYTPSLSCVSKYPLRQTLRQPESFRDSEFKKSTRTTELREKGPLSQQNVGNRTRQLKQKPTIYRREVYLQRQTVLVDDDDDDKLPTFIQASFGNLQGEGNPLENKQTIKSQHYTAKNTKSMSTTYRLESTEEEKIKMEKIKLRTEGYEREWESRRRGQDGGGWQGKKTNYPYIKQDYKLAEPKTQLGKMQRCIKQEKGNKENMDGRKTYLYVMSKKPKKSLFAQ